MSDVNELAKRIEGAFSAVKDKAQQQMQERLGEFQQRQGLLKEYEKAQAKIVEIAKPRLEVLAKRAGDRAKVTPSVAQTRRAATFEFKSSKALMDLTFSVSPDREVKNAVVESDLKVVPVLWKFDCHSEFSTPIAKVDTDGLTKWLDDRILSFVNLYIQIHEGEVVDKAEMVEDPVAKISFPKFAAGATLEQGGKTHYFIDEKNKAEFAKQKGTAKA
jgi:YHS domain-containing protein